MMQKKDMTKYSIIHDKNPQPIKNRRELLKSIKNTNKKTRAVIFNVSKMIIEGQMN